MKSVAIISEYNPFHNGHAYQAAQARKAADAEIVVAIMSGQFTQRGEPAFLNKFIRAEMALAYCDLVVELPQFYAVSYADDFADGAIQAANILGVDALSFGAENPDLALLSTEIEQRLDIKSGESYARQMNQMRDPNNILARQYIQSAQQHMPDLTFYPILRINNQYHDTHLTDTISSATAIRKAFFSSSDFKSNVPNETYRLMCENDPVSWNDFYPYLKYQILSQSPHQLNEIYMMTEGLEYRLKKFINDYDNFSDYMAAVKTKRYTYTRLQRLMIYTLLNIKAKDAYPEVEMLRVLAMNDTGRKFIKDKPNIVTNTNKKNASHFELEIKATQIYNHISNSTQTEFNTPVIYQ